MGGRTTRIGWVKDVMLGPPFRPWPPHADDAVDERLSMREGPPEKGGGTVTKGERRTDFPRRPHQEEERALGMNRPRSAMPVLTR
jgi:hypothetical protein